MSTPGRGNSSSDKDIRTPFKERALHEKRLRDEVLLLSTPGWKQGIQGGAPGRDQSTISPNPQSLNSYLRELSSLLLQNNAQYNSKSIGESAANTRPESSELDSRSQNDRDNARGEINNRVKDGLTDSVSSDEEVNATEIAFVKRPLSQAIFSTLEPNLRRKSRRLGDDLDVVILDDTMSVKESRPVGDFHASDNQLPVEELPHVASLQLISTESMENDDILPIEDEAMQVQSEEVNLRVTYPDEDISMESPHEQNNVEQDKFDIADDLDMLLSEEDSDASNTDPSVHPISLKQLRSIIKCSSNTERLAIPHSTLKMLRQISSDFIHEVGQDLRQLSSSGGTVIDRNSILSIFTKYGIISDQSTNLELFEMCAKYLSAEDLNILEIALFGS